MAVKRRMPMCYFNDLERINNKNEIQTMITRIISSQTQRFNYESIVSEIQNRLRDLGVEESFINSFRLDEMISDTLDQMVGSGRIYTFNNVYVPIHQKIKTVQRLYAYA